MNARDWMCLGIFLGTLLCFVIRKKKDVWDGFAVGMGAALLAGSLLHFIV